MFPLLYLSLDLEASEIKGELIENITERNTKEIVLEYNLLEASDVQVYFEKCNLNYDLVFTYPKISEIFEKLPEIYTKGNIETYLQQLHQAQKRFLIQIKITFENYQEEVSGRLKINYKMKNPKGSLFFNNQLNKKFLMTSSSQSKFYPKRKGSQLKRIVLKYPKNFIAFCSGNSCDEFLIENTNERVSAYEIIDENLIGIFCGPVSKVFELNGIKVFMSFYSQNNLKSVSLSELKEIFEDIYQCVEDYVIKFEEFPQGLDVIFVPSVLNDFSECSPLYSFPRFCIVDENSLCGKNFKERAGFFKAHILRNITASILYEKVKLNHYYNDRWIIDGISIFTADLVKYENQIDQKLYFYKNYSKLISNMKKCKELWPVSGFCISPETRFSDPLYYLKVGLIMRCLTSVGNINKGIASILINKTNLEIEEFIKSLKNSFGLKKVNTKMYMLATKTGGLELDIDWVYSRKENKIELEVHQNPLSMKHLISETERRLKLEKKYYHHENPLLKDLLDSGKKPFIPQFLSNLEITHLKTLLLISETNEIDFNEETHVLSLEEKPEQKVIIHCRSKFRKAIQKKVGEEEDSDDDSLFEAPKKVSLFNLNNPSRNPVIWLKIDPDLEYMRKINQPSEENFILIQISKEKDPVVIMFLIKNLLKNKKSPASINALCSLIESKSIHYLVKGRIIKCLLKISSSSTGWRALDILFTSLKNFVLEKNGSVKRNNFSRFDNYIQIRFIIKGLGKIKESGNRDFIRFVTPSIISLLLKMSKQNDNTFNPYDDSYYLASILSTLLSLETNESLNEITDEIFAYLKKEQIFPSYYYLILKKILKKINIFYHINKTNLSQESYNRIHNEIMFMWDVYKENSLISTEFFDYFIYRKLLVKGDDVDVILIKALKKFEEFKPTSNIRVLEGYAKSIFAFVEKNTEFFRSDIYELRGIKKVNTLCDLIWEEMISPFCLINPVCRLYFMNIFLVFNFHFPPLGMELPNFGFPKIDSNWLRKEHKLLFKEGSRRKNTVLKLKHLCMNKKRKYNNEKSVIDCREVIMSGIKNPSDQVMWRNICKSIVNFLLNEKETERIEKDNFTEEIENGKETESKNDGSFVFKIKTTLSLKTIKKRLVKLSYDSFEDVKDDVRSVVKSYYSKKMISQEIYEEYENLVSELFKEGENIIEEIKNKKAEKAEKHSKIIKISLQE